METNLFGNIYNSSAEEISSFYKNYYRQLAIQERYEKKEAHIQKIFEEYHASVQHYYNTFHTILNCLWYTNFYAHFYLYEEDLYFHNFKIRNSKNFFQRLKYPTTEDGTLEDTIINAIKQLLSYSVHSSWNCLNYYQQVLCRQTSPVFSSFPQYFQVYDGNLYFNNGRALFCITYKTYREFFQRIQHPIPPKSLAKKIFSVIKSTLSVKTESANMTPRKDSFYTYKVCKKDSNPVFVRIHFDTAGEHFIAESFTPKDTLKQISIAELSSNTLKAPSKELSRNLYQLTNGNLALLEKMAILTANILAPSILTPRLYIIVCSKESAKIILANLILPLLKWSPTAPEMQLLFTDFKHLIKSNAYGENAILKYLGYGAYLIHDATPLAEENDIKYLKQIIKGHPVSTPDKLIKKVTWSNTFPIICFPQSHKELTSLRNTYPHVLLDFSFLKPENPIIPSTDNSYWLRTTLALYGLNLQASGKHKLKQHRTPHFANFDEIVSDFINTCCKVTKEGFTYADELYQAYSLFFTKKYAATPFLRKDFVNHLKIRGTFTYTRPHVSRNQPNKWAFTNILLHETYREIIDAIPAPEITIEEASFIEQLEELSQSINREIEQILP